MYFHENRISGTNLKDGGNMEILALPVYPYTGLLLNEQKNRLRKEEMKEGRK